MRCLPQVLFLLALSVWVQPAFATDHVTSVGPGLGLLVPGERENPCPGSTEVLNFDGTAENAWNISPFLIEPPDWGAMAEGYPGVGGLVCGASFFLTAITGGHTWQLLDIFVYAYDGTTGNPGAVLSLTPSITVEGVAFWPNVSRFDIPISPAVAGSEGFFVGYWPHPWDPGPERPFTCNDEDTVGVPRVKLFGGAWECPDGWQPASCLDPSITSWAIGAWVAPIPVPTQESTWGAVKSLYW